MAIYIFVFLFLIAARVGVPYPAIRRRLLPVLTAGVFAFCAFRFEVGCDWWGYLYQFEVSQDTNFAPTGEQIWWELIALLQTLDFTALALNVITAAVFFVGFYFFSRRQSDPLGLLALSYPILVVNIVMSGIRQGAAMGLLFFAYNAFIDRRPIRYIAWVFAASLVHASSIIFLLAAPLIGRKLTLVNMTLAFLGTGAAAYFLLGSTAAHVATERYVGTNVDAAGAVYRVSLLAISGLIYLALFRRKWEEKSPAEARLATVASFAMLFLPAVLLASSVIADRIGYFLVPVQVLLFTKFPDLSTKHLRLAVAIGPYHALLAVFVVWLLNSRYFQQCYVPYNTWLFNFG